ncbi:alpha/beta hydrolase [Limisalsivibrio acetivorans]|uniref:alpha/beta hydrolase n=1 Tax=Limisalsivibrio acetivorans TaxID=1304888 RepID=UPI00138AC36B|nr:alpha/beta hydrolase [Limisalsivibrio acetivorans]
MAKAYDLSPYIIRYQCTGNFTEIYNYNPVPLEQFEKNGYTIKKEKYKAQDKYIGVISYYPLNKPKGVIVFFHGGGWTGGKPEQISFIGEYFASLGFAVHLPEYTKVWDSHMPFISVRDAKYAYLWAYNKHRTRSYVDNFIVGGESAGGHLALSMLTIPLFSYNLNVKPSKLVLINPVTRLREGGYYRKDYRVNARFIEPYNYISPGLPTTLIVHGDRDNTVPYEDSWDTNMKINKAGNTSYLCNSRTLVHGYYYENLTKRISLLNVIRTFLMGYETQDNAKK